MFYVVFDFFVECLDVDVVDNLDGFAAEKTSLRGISMYLVYCIGSVLSPTGYF